MSEALPLPLTEQEQRAKWDLLLLDLEHRAEQCRNLREDTHWKPWIVVSASMTAGAAWTAAIFTLAKYLSP